jgi:hypothetical protein
VSADPLDPLHTLLSTQHARRRYELARGVLWGLLLATFVLVLSMMLLLLASIRSQQQTTLRAQHTLRDLQEQQRDLTQALHDGDVQRAALAQQAIARLLQGQQDQLDQLEARDLARMRAILAAIDATNSGRPAPKVVLVPVPARTSSPTPTPRPTPQPAPTCVVHGHRCK